jgi:hypothetical protein
MVIVSVILSYVALTLGLIGAVTMMSRLGRAGDGRAGTALLWIHRLAGYGFIAIMTFLFAGMLFKLAQYPNALSPRVVWHGAAGFAVVAFLFLKWATVRPFRGLLRFAPALGFVVFGLAVIVVNFGATLTLFAAAKKEEIKAAEPTTTAEVKKMHDEMLALEQTPKGEPLHEARFVFAEKCGRCHHLRRPFENPQKDWHALIERMRSYKRGWISDVDAADIEFYLTHDYGPGG